MKGKIVHSGVVQGIHFWDVVFDDPYAMVGQFLSADVRHSVEMCDEYLRAAMDVVSGKGQGKEIRGDFSLIRIMPQSVLIGSEYSDPSVPPVIITMEAFLSVLNYWRSIHLSWGQQNLPRDQQIPPVDPPEFFYDEPSVPGLSPDAAKVEFEKMESDWSDIPQIHHRSQLES